LDNEIDYVFGGQVDLEIYTCPICQRVGNVLIPSVENGFQEEAFLSFKGVNNGWNRLFENAYTSLLIQFVVAELLERREPGECYTFENGPDSRIVNALICYLQSNGMPEVMEKLSWEFYAIGEYNGFLERFLSPEANLLTVRKSLDPPSLMPMEQRLDQLISRLSTVRCLLCPMGDCDFAVCMICQMAVCPRRLCCSRGALGECFLHRRACGFDTVPFFWVKKCKILIVGVGNASFCTPPFLDERWGEELVHGKAAGKINRFNPEKYRRFEKAWLAAELVNWAIAGEAESVENSWFSY
jgi:hypothetical protein